MYGVTKKGGQAGTPWLPDDSVLGDYTAEKLSDIKWRATLERRSRRATPTGLREA